MSDLDPEGFVSGGDECTWPVHAIEEVRWPARALSLCERAAGGTGTGGSGWHFYTDQPHAVTCQSCLEWMHA